MLINLLVKRPCVDVRVFMFQEVIRDCRIVFEGNTRMVGYEGFLTRSCRYFQANGCPVEQEAGNNKKDAKVGRYQEIKRPGRVADVVSILYGIGQPCYFLIPACG